MNAVTTNEGGRLGELLFRERRNREKVNRNTLRCRCKTACVEKTRARIEPIDGGLSRDQGPPKSLDDNNLRTATAGCLRRPGRRGAGNNRDDRPGGVLSDRRNRRYDNDLRLNGPIRRTAVFVPRGSNWKKKPRRCLPPLPVPRSRGDRQMRAMLSHVGNVPHVKARWKRGPRQEGTPDLRALSTGSLASGSFTARPVSAAL